MRTCSPLFDVPLGVETDFENFTVVHTPAKNLSVVQLVARPLLGLTYLSAIQPVTIVTEETPRGTTRHLSWRELLKHV